MRNRGVLIGAGLLTAMGIAMLALAFFVREKAMRDAVLARRDPAPLPKADTREFDERIAKGILFEHRDRQVKNPPFRMSITKPVGKEYLDTLKGLDNLVELDIAFDTFDDAFLSQLTRYSRIKKLEIRRGLFQGPGAQELRKFPRLETLTFFLVNISDDALHEIGKNVKIKNLTLSSVPATGKGLASFQGLEKVARLDAAFERKEDSRGDATLEGLKDNPSLLELRILYSNVTDAGLAHLNRFPKLTRVEFHFNTITDQGMQVFRQCPSLQEISLAYNYGAITDAGIRELRHCPILQKLDLRALKKIDGSGLEALEDCPIQHLVLEKTGIVDRNLAIVGKFKVLETLDLYDTGITDAGLTELAKLAKLKTLTLTRTKVTGAGLAALKELAGLRELDLSFSPLDPVGIDRIVELKQLEKLAIVKTPLTDADLDRLAALPNLTSLAISRSNTTDRGVEKLKNARPGIFVYVDRP